MARPKKQTESVVKDTAGTEPEETPAQVPSWSISTPQNDWGMGISMTIPDGIKSIYEKLILIMEEVKYVQKENKMVNNQYTFVSHDAVTKAVRDAAVKQKVLIISTVKSWEQDKNRTSCTLSVRFVNAEYPLDHFEIESFGFGIDTQDKGPGKAVSYAFKYALLKVLMLETGDDPERSNQDYDDKITFDQQMDIEYLKDSLNVDLTKTLEFFKVKNIQELNQEQARQIIQQLKSKK